MLAVSSRRPLTSGQGIRRAFTLLEVLVVVAIIVVLASAASVAVFRELENAKQSRATQDLAVLDQQCKGLILKTTGMENAVTAENFQLENLIQVLERGANSLIDPWGQRYQHFPETNASGDSYIVFFTVNPKTGERVFKP